MFSTRSLYGSGLHYGLINAHTFTQTVSVRLHFNVGIKPSVRNLKSKCHKGFLFFLSKILSALWFAAKIYVTGLSRERMCILSMWESNKWMWVTLTGTLSQKEKDCVQFKADAIPGFFFFLERCCCYVYFSEHHNKFCGGSISLIDLGHRKFFRGNKHLM